MTETRTNGQFVADGQQLPAGASPIDTDELLATIGELYVQTRIQRKMLAQVQAELRRAISQQ